MDLVTILSVLLLLVWCEESSFIENILINLTLIALGIFSYFFFPWFISKYGPDEFKERKSPD